MNKIVNVEIRGISALLMHQFPLVPIENPPLEKRTPEEQAELAAYRDPDNGGLYVPGIAVQRCLIAAAAYSKGKGRASLQKQAAACLLIDPERISLGTKEFKVDARPVVIPATKGRVIRYRARLDDWRIAFSLEYDPNLLDEKQARTIVDDAGSRVGCWSFGLSVKAHLVGSWSSNGGHCCNGQGKARHGMARPGVAWLGEARQGNRGKGTGGFDSRPRESRGEAGRGPVW